MYGVTDTADTSNNEGTATMIALLPRKLAFKATWLANVSVQMSWLELRKVQNAGDNNLGRSNMAAIVAFPLGRRETVTCGPNATMCDVAKMVAEQL